MKIYDTVSQTRITFIERPADSPRADLFKCTLHGQDENTLLIGWADQIKVARVRNCAARPTQPLLKQRGTARCRESAQRMSWGCGGVENGVGLGLVLSDERKAANTTARFLWLGEEITSLQKRAESAPALLRWLTTLLPLAACTPSDKVSYSG